MKKVTNLDMYRIDGTKTERKVTIDWNYLNKRVRRYCPWCEEVTLQDPYDTTYQCNHCDFYNKDTDLGQVINIGGWMKP